MNRDAFLKQLTAKLYPILRSKGFRGSGTTLRRVNGQVVHVFNAQGSASGDGCYLNLGAHLLFLPSPGGSVPQAAAIKEYECVFRDRIDSPAGSHIGWSYGDNADQMNESVDFICDHWEMYERSFFDRFAEYPRSFIALLEGTDLPATHPIELLTLARIADHLGDHPKCIAFVEEGLQRCPTAATGLKAQLQKLAISPGQA